MPVIINELVIRAVVDSSSAGSGGPSPGQNGAGRAEKEAIVAECVEQVLEILAQKRER
jgi:hypothetical protein